MRLIASLLAALAGVLLPVSVTRAQTATVNVPPGTYVAAPGAFNNTVLDFVTSRAAAQWLSTVNAQAEVVVAPGGQVQAMSFNWLLEGKVPSAYMCATSRASYTFSGAPRIFGILAPGAAEGYAPGELAGTRRVATSAGEGRTCAVPRDDSGPSPWQFFLAPSGNAILLCIDSSPHPLAACRSGGHLAILSPTAPVAPPAPSTAASPPSAAPPAAEGALEAPAVDDEVLGLCAGTLTRRGVGPETSREEAGAALLLCHEEVLAWEATLDVLLPPPPETGSEKFLECYKQTLRMTIRESAAQVWPDTGSVVDRLPAIVAISVQSCASEAAA